MGVDMTEASRGCRSAVLLAYLMFVGVPENQTIESYYARVLGMTSVKAVESLKGTDSWRAFHAAWLVQSNGILRERGYQFNLGKMISTVLDVDESSADSIVKEMITRGYLTMGRGGGVA